MPKSNLHGAFVEQHARLIQMMQLSVDVFIHTLS